MMTQFAWITLDDKGGCTFTYGVPSVPEISCYGYIYYDGVHFVANDPEKGCDSTAIAKRDR